MLAGVFCELTCSIRWGADATYQRQPNIPTANNKPAAAVLIQKCRGNGEAGTDKMRLRSRNAVSTWPLTLDDA